jgi:hypothetical protein
MDEVDIARLNTQPRFLRKGVPASIARSPAVAPRRAAFGRRVRVTAAR